MICNYQVDVLRDERHFYDLRDEWTELLTTDDNATVFQAWEFLYPHWKYRKKGRLLYLITLRSNDGKLQAIAPFWIQVVKKGITLKIIEFIGTRGLDYLDFVISREADTKKIMNNILLFIYNNRKDWDIISLSELRINSKKIIEEIIMDMGRKYTFFKCSTCVKINLPPAWENYRNSLGRSTRKDINYDENRLSKSFDTIFSVHSDHSPELLSTVCAMQDIHQDRWLKSGEKGSFSSKWLKDLDKDIIIESTKKGILKYFTLYLNSKPVASLSGFSLRDTIFTHTMSVSIDERFRKFSIGNVLLQKAVKWSIDNGYKIFDLSRGDEQYKFKFGGTSENNYRVEIYKNAITKKILNLGKKVYNIK